LKINLRILCKKDAKATLVKDAEVAAACDLRGPTLDLDEGHPLFDRILVLTKGTEGCWFNPLMEFTKAETGAVRFFQLECRKLVREGPGDYEVNVARLRSLPFLETGGGRKIRLLERIALRCASLKANEIACAGDWMAEFVAHREAGRIFESEGLTGLSLRPVFDPKAGKDYEDLFQLYTDSLMPPVELDLTTPPHPDSPAKKPRQLACLTYDFGKGNEPVSDFNRTAEAWSSNDMPAWVVTSRVREVFTRNKLRGWAFRPVLEKGTDLHAAYLAKWQDLIDRISASNTRHFF
jgi:hypothetical protein